MLNFKEQVNETTGMRLIDLLPKKVKRMIYRYAHQDKYKGALLMMKELLRNPDIIKRGLSKTHIQGIAADHFGLDHREFSKVLNRKTRYEEVTEEKYIAEAYTISYTGPDDIKHINFSDSHLGEIDTLYKQLKDKHANPLIFDTNPKQKQVKVHTDLQGKIELPTGSVKFKFGKGSLSNVKTVELEDFGIKTATDFLEFFQCIGLQIGTALTPTNFESTLLQLFIGGDWKIRTYIPQWDKFVKYCNEDKEIQKDVIMLVNGSFYYRKEVTVTKPYVIWNGIGKYYDALKKKEGIVGNIKKNTADCVLIDGALSDLYAALDSNEPIITSDDGKLTCNGIDWYQISLKKADGQAKLGKITNLIKGKYEPDQKNMDLAKLNDLFNEDINHYIAEGFFGDVGASMKKLGGETFKKFQTAAANILKFGKKLFNTMSKLGKKYEKDVFKDIEKLTKRSKYLKEGALNEKASQVDMMNAVVRDPLINKKYLAVIEKSFNNIDSVGNEVVDIRVIKNPSVKIDAVSINFLMSNVISFKLLNNIIEDVKKNGIGVINDLNQSMSMGDTKLPVVKVYGNESKADYKIITVGTITQNNPLFDGKQVKVLKVSVKPFKTYWTVNMWIFAEIDSDGVSKYHRISFKKSGASYFSYNIEGVGTVPEHKITEFK